MTPAAMGQGRERKARLPPAKPGSRWPWACACPRAGGLPGGCVGCPSATRSTHGPPVGVRGAGGPTRGQVACLVCVSGSGGQCRGRGAYLVAVLVLVGLPVGPCACWVPVGACWVLVCLPVARGCAGWPAWWPACWCACPWFRGSKTLKFTQRHTPEPATVPPQAGQCVPFRHIEFNVQGQQ